MASKKVILFIVEGITDQISLDLVLSKLIEEDKKVRFKVVRTDITTQRGTNQANILTKITEQIKEFMEQEKIQKKDIAKVVHIVDMDGAYIPSSSVIYKDIEELEYTLNSINTKNVDGIVRRNMQKADILNKLSSTPIVYKNLPYQVYFLSCNLEHVLHDKLNISDAEKEILSFAFSKQFKENPKDFLIFIKNPVFALTTDYKASWDFIKQDNNSLNRHTNFGLFFE